MNKKATPKVAVLLLAAALTSCGLSTSGVPVDARLFLEDGARLPEVTGRGAVAFYARPRNDFVRARASGGTFTVGGRTYTGDRVRAFADGAQIGDVAGPLLRVCGDLPQGQNVAVSYTITDEGGALLDSGNATISAVRGACP